jgi:hypothetical protein
MRNSRIFGGRFVTLICCILLAAGGARAGEEEKVYSKLPIREVTVFKDGHAYVLHEGSVPTDGQGNVVLDYLPSPIMGTFWTYSADREAKLVSVVSSRDSVEVKAEAGDLADLIRANLQSQVLITENSGKGPYQAQLVKLLNNQIVLVHLVEGTRALPLGQIRDITFLADPLDQITRPTAKDTLTLTFDRRRPQSTAAVGMAYVQKGIRWIPSYRVEIDGQGKALIKLQGTIINELADLEDVKAHLVIGVPRFVFQDTPDPISFQETIARLSQHFNPNSSTAYSFDNSIRSQARFTEMPRYDQNAAGGNDSVPQMESMGQNEDLFVFSLDHITLKKGQRMVLPIAEYTLGYEDIYTVDLPFAPPLEMQRNFNSDQHLQLARLFHAPKAMHKIRLTNKSDYPLTTAPASIFKDGRILAQGMMTHTTIGGKGDLDITTAVEITVKNSDQQTHITPNAVNWNGTNFSKVDMQGSITLTNYSARHVKLEVKRSVMGALDTADREGRIKQLGHGTDSYVFEGGLPHWWNWCSWPWWWYHFNSIGQADWTVNLEPGQSVDLAYTWHYFWN